MTKRYVLYHNDIDGFGAAFLARKKLKGKVSCIPVNYNQPLPNIEDGSEVYIVDFSYSRKVLIELNHRVSKLVVLDHHKTAKSDLAGLKFAIFDDTSSGTGMAWKYFHNGTNENLPKLFAHIQDFDLWRFDLPKTREIAAALISYPFDFKVWTSLIKDLPKLETEGEAILRFQRQQVQSLAKLATIVEMDGKRAISCYAQIFTAEVAHFLLEKYRGQVDFAATYYIDEDGNRRWSLRSEGDVDVGEIALHLKGGGHKNSAGFVEKVEK